MSKLLAKIKKPWLFGYFGPNFPLLKKKKTRVFLGNQALSVFRFYNIYYHVKHLKKLVSSYQGKLWTDRGTKRQATVISWFIGVFLQKSNKYV